MMCTVSWIHQPEGYHLLCNRDERRTRGIAASPGVFEHSGARFVAPVDADHGGTWIAVNEHGLGLCLLNGRSWGPPARGERSRGLVIPELIWLHSGDECAFVLGRLDLEPFAPFTVLMLEPGQPAIVAAWDGSALAIDRHADHRAPLVSSSFDPEGVRRSRTCEFVRRATGDVTSLFRFHTNHGDGGAGDPYSPCMHRPDAETVSFSWVVVTRDEVRFLYVPTAPCRCAPGEQSILPRAA
jgi:hypothetical protein